MSKKLPVIIIGSGGHASVLIEILQILNQTIIGVADPFKEIGTEVGDVTVIGGDDVITKYSKEKVLLVNGVGSIPGSTQRLDVSVRFRSLGYEFASVISPSAILSSNASVDEGVQIMPGVIVQPHVKIGLDSIINTGSIIEHDCIIGKSCHIAPGSIFSGGVILGDRVHVGTGATVVQNIKIGSGSVIGAGSLVLNDVNQNVKFIQKRVNLENFLER